MTNSHFFKDDGLSKNHSAGLPVDNILFKKEYIKSNNEYLHPANDFLKSPQEIEQELKSPDNKLYHYKTSKND